MTATIKFVIIRFIIGMFIGSLVCVLPAPWDVAVCVSLGVVSVVLVWLQSGSSGKRKGKRRTTKAKPVVKQRVVKPADVPEMRSVWAGPTPKQQQPMDLEAWLNDDSDVIDTWSPQVVKYTMDEYRNRKH